MRPVLANFCNACLVLMALAAPAYAEDVAQPDAGTAQADSGAADEAKPAMEVSLNQLPTEDEPIHAGETVSVTYEITHPAGATVTFPEAFTPDRWVLVNAVPQPNQGAEKASTTTWVATFGIYRPGATTLAPFEITITGAAGQSATVTTKPVEVKVLSIFADVNEEPTFNAPRPPVVVWVEDYTLAYVGGGALLLALLGLVAFFVHRRQMMIPPPPPPPRAAHEVALEKLSALAADDLVERGEYMIYWVRMSEAVREYMGRTYGFGGTELTTTEMLEVLEKVTWPKGIGFEDVKGFLRRCDEVKFGGQTPGVDESTSTLRRAFSIVELTKPRLPAPGEEAGVERAGEDDGGRAKPSSKPKSKWAPPDEPKKKRRRPKEDGERKKRRPPSDDDEEAAPKSKPAPEEDA